ncbi:MAG: methyltransferase domain-containing protein [Anaerolineales bacterium]|nr:methyltransferase domain-containing protein [Anaerolineales bacterium]
MRTTQNDDLALIVSSDFKQYFLRLKPGDELQTHRGILRHDDLIGIPWGSEIRSHLDLRYYIVEPTLRDLLLNIKRQSQIIFPKDIGYILLRLSVAPGMTVLEAGTGSGALTTALAWAVGSEGKVISYDRREDMQELARRNLARVGLQDRVEFRLRDIEDGIDEKDVDALFLDLPNPNRYITQARDAIINGGSFGAILPTSNQVSALLKALQQNEFELIDVCEILLRFYKPVPERLRPTDRMVAHTGFLIFARAVVPQSTVDTDET